MLRLGELGFGATKSNGDGAIEDVPCRVGLNDPMLGIMHKQMDFGLPTKGPEVQLRLVEVGVMLIEMVIFSLDNLSSRLPNPGVIPVQVLRTINRRFHFAVTPEQSGSMPNDIFMLRFSHPSLIFTK